MQACNSHCVSNAVAADAVNAISTAAADFPDEVLEQLEALDMSFSYPHDLTDLLFTYVSRYPEEFGELPRVDD